MRHSRSSKSFKGVSSYSQQAAREILLILFSTLNPSFLCAPQSIATSSEQTCNNELTMFVEVAVVLPLPTHSRSSWGPRMLRAFRAQSLNLINVSVHISETNQSLIRVVVVKIQCTSIALSDMRSGGNQFRRTL
jgi:hypothetical protein